MILDNDSQRWRTLYEISRYLHQQDPSIGENLLQGVLERIGTHTNLRSGCIVTFADDDNVEDALTLDMDAMGASLWEHLYNQGLIGFVHHSARTIIIRDINHDARWPTPPASINAPSEGSAIGVPLQVAGNSLGVMLFVHPQIDGFDAKVTAMLEEVGMIVAQTLNNVRIHRNQRDSSEHFQWLFDDLITPVLLTDRSGKIIKANREASRFLGYHPDKLLGQSIKDIHLSRKRRPDSEKETSLKTNHLSAFRTHMRSANGEELPVRLKMRKRWFKNESVIEYVMQDVRTEVELTRLRQDLTAMVFHDLRGPIQNIKFSLAALQRFVPVSDPATAAFASADSSVTQLSRMVASLLDIQRLEGSSTILNVKKASLEKLVHEAHAQTMAIVEAAGLSFVVDVEKDIPSVMIDADMIRRVVTNMVENAAKYASDGGSVTLRAFKDINEIHLVVTDDGPGIPEEMRERIFDKFSQLNRESSPGGVGLGLAFCKLAIEAHEGRIWVESEPGQGAQFHFTVPAAGMRRASPPQVARGSA
ncbi:MAG: ATP-binding protein [Chloroflexota bacterium]